MLDSSVLAFTLAALIVTISPGPDTFLVIANAARGGLRNGLATTIGIASGGFFHAALFGIGVARLLAYSPGLFLAVKLGGAAYLLFLGLGALRRTLWPPPGAASSTALPHPLPGAGHPGRCYLQGLVTNALNPKVAVFYLAFLPQFIRPGDSIAVKSVLLIGIHYSLGLVWLSLVAVAANGIGTFLRRARVQRWLEGFVGIVMTTFGVKLAVASN